MRQQGRTSPRTPYSTEYRNRKGFSETIQDHAERLKNVELRATRTPLPGESVVEVRLNGVPVGAHNILDLIEGANVTLTVSDDGQVIHIEIAATGGSSTGYDTIEDEGTPLAQETVLDFQGAGVTATAGVGKTVVTIPGGSSSGGGVFAADAVVAPNFPGADGDTTTLATGEIVFIYKTPQAMYDAYANGDFPAAPGTRAVVRINRTDYNDDIELDMSAAAGAIYLMGEAQFALDNFGGGVAKLGTVSIVDPDSGVVMENLLIVTALIASGANASDQGMLLQLTNVAIDTLTGGIRGFTPVAMQNVAISSWEMSPTAQATSNVVAQFEHVYVGGGWADFGADVVIAGVYSFATSTFNGGISFVVGTDKHFAFTAECHMYFDMAFQMDGGTLTLDLDAFHLHDGARIVITDLGGGGNVIINWSGGSVEQTAAPVIEADATIVVTGSVDGVALLGTPNSPAFKGQFVDFAFGDAITPPSYVVEFL